MNTKGIREMRDTFELEMNHTGKTRADTSK